MVHDGGMPATTLAATLAAAAASASTRTMPIWMCLLTGLIAAAIDWTGVGPDSLRDRFAAILYLASGLGWSQQLGLAAWEAKMLAPLSHDARVIWAMAAVVPIGFWIGAMAPPLRILGRVGELKLRKAGGATPAKTENGRRPAAAGEHINTYLLGWTLAVVAACPITMPASAYDAIVGAMAGTVTTTATAVGTAVGGFFGWN
jgi:hypothetical protein